MRANSSRDENRAGLVFTTGPLYGGSWYIYWLSENGSGGGWSSGVPFARCKVMSDAKVKMLARRYIFGIESYNRYGQ